MEPPPHSLHRERRRPCGQALHTLQFDRYFTPCSHGPFVGGALFRFVPLLDAPSANPTSTSTSGSGPLTFGRQIAGIHPRAPSKCPAGRETKRIKVGKSHLGTKVGQGRPPLESARKTRAPRSRIPMITGITAPSPASGLASRRGTFAGGGGGGGGVGRGPLSRVAISVRRSPSSLRVAAGARAEPGSVREWIERNLDAGAVTDVSRGGSSGWAEFSTYTTESGKRFFVKTSRRDPSMFIGEGADQIVPV